MKTIIDSNLQRFTKLSFMDSSIVREVEDTYEFQSEELTLSIFNDLDLAELVNCCDCLDDYRDLFYEAIGEYSKRYEVDISEDVSYKLYLYIELINLYVNFSPLVPLECILNSMKIAHDNGKNTVDEISIAEYLNHCFHCIDKFKEMKENNYSDLVQTAYHEAGHYIVGIESKDYIPLVISIIPTKCLCGLVSANNYGLNKSLSEKDYLNDIAKTLAGAISEDIKFSSDGAVHISGRSVDLSSANDMAKYMVLALGVRNFPSLSLGRYTTYYDYETDSYYDLSDSQKDDLTKEIDEILKKSRNIAKNILRTNQEKLDILAEALLVRGALTREQADDLCNKKKTLEDMPEPIINLIK